MTEAPTTFADDVDAVDVLLVEDDADDAHLTLRALARRRTASRVAWVADGVEAMEFLFAEGRYAGRADEPPPQLVLLDLKLPRADGLQVLRRIRADDRLGPIPVVALTSSSQDRDVEAAYEAGVNSFVTKPVEYATFQAVVEELGAYWLDLNRGPELEPP
jgi:two-component system, response regulator